MNYLKRRRLYEALPPAIKRAVGFVPFAVLAGKPYRGTVRRGSWFDVATRDQLLKYQEIALQKVLDFATTQVPAYRNFRGAVERLPPFEALKRFPLLTKEKLQDDFEDYLPANLEKIAHYESTTGGTSGNQLKFLLDNHSQHVELAFMHRQWSRVGYTTRSKKATFRGVEFPKLRNAEYWRDNPIYNEISFSPYHMNVRTMGAYWGRLTSYRPAFLHGYPSAVSLLARFMLENGLRGDQLGLKAILLGSEGTSHQQRGQIESAFCARAFTWYGHSERLILAGECEHSTSYHQMPDYGLVEIVQEETGEAVEEGDMGELVGTGLLNRSLPLIRYRTGDRARRLPWRCRCGRGFDRFTDVQGRWKQEYVIGKRGSKISPAALNMHGEAFKDVLRYQYYQKIPGVLEIRLMVTSRFDGQSQEALVSAFGRKLGDELRVIPRIVDDIPLTPRGKLRRLIQDIPETGAKL